MQSRAVIGPWAYASHASTQSANQRESVAGLAPGIFARCQARGPLPAVRQFEADAASLILAMASSMVKLLGFWMAGNSLKVSAN